MTRDKQNGSSHGMILWYFVAEGGEQEYVFREKGDYWRDSTAGFSVIPQVTQRPVAFCWRAVQIKEKTDTNISYMCAKASTMQHLGLKRTILKNFEHVCRDWLLDPY